MDTSAWYAMVVRGDANHAAAAEWLRRRTEPLLTTDDILDETLTLLRTRGYRSQALELGEGLFGGKVAAIHYVTPELVLEAWRVFRRFKDKDWSFTDCTSHVVMHQLRMEFAFAFDDHFRQFGTVTVVP